MQWLDVSTENCSVQAALDVVGPKWTMLVIRELFNGVYRFDEMHQHTGISEAVLSRRLRELQQSGLVESLEYQEPGRRTRREYRLTESGLDLFPVLIALLNWGDKYRAPDRGESWQVRHKGCGERVFSAVVCPDHPDHSLDHRGTVTNAGPGAIALVDRPS